ncbi:MAG: hypothetical protein HYV28_08240 [Ignavibacteriales bacterium]|nr:hypothetical protein [Ignavibacteriales bacterium]
MIKRIISLVLFYGLLIPLIGQNLDELLDQVDLKLRKDNKYLNIHYINFPNNKINDLLKGVPRTNYREPFTFKAADNITYNVVFLKDAVGLDSIIVLYIDEITDKSQGEGAGMFSSTGGPQSDTIRALTYKDLYNIQAVKPEVYSLFYNEIYRYILDNPDQPVSSLLKIQPDNEIKTSLGISSRDNTDFLNFQRANNLHWYPKQKIVVKGRRGAQQTATDSVEYRIDAGFTSVSFSHRSMDFSLGGASLELGVEERMLNLLPFQQMSVNSAFRTLVNLSDKKEDIDKALVIDAKLLARVALDMADLPGSLPFMGASKPKLMLGTAGGIDVSLTRPFGLPFLNLYVMSGAAPSLSNPSTKALNKQKKYAAYYNISSFEASMSFYWNTSETMISRFRLDVGLGYYDIYEAIYANATAKAPSTKKLVQDKFFPSLTLHFNFAPGNVDIYHGEIRFFDGQARVTGWLKLMELEDGHVFRFGGTLISPPVGRPVRNWEAKGGALVQIRYRYGF